MSKELRGRRRSWIALPLAGAALAAMAFAPVRLADEERLAAQLLKYPPRCVVCTVVHEQQSERVQPVQMQQPQPRPKVPAKRWADRDPYGPRVLQAQAAPKPKRPARPPEVTYARITQHVTVVRCVVLKPRCK